MISLRRSEANTFRTRSSSIMSNRTVRHQGVPVVGPKDMGGKRGVAKIERGSDNQETGINQSLKEDYRE
jgi:hypothetical protein